MICMSNGNMNKISLKLMCVSLYFLIHTICFAGINVELFGAADTGDIAKAKQAISTGADVNIKNAEDLTALHMAATWNDVLKDRAQSGKFEIAKLLIRKGADVNAKDHMGSTPMHWAAEQQNFEFVRLLTENGARVDSKDKFGRTPLQFTVSTSWHGASIVAKFLIENGAKVDSKDKSGGTPLHKSTMGPNPKAIKLLIWKGADVNAADNRGLTPLHIAAKYGRVDVAKLLIEHGADIKARTTETVRIESWEKTFPAGSTPLNIASIVRKKKLVNFLRNAERAEILFRKAYEKYREKNDVSAVVLYEKALKYNASGKIYYNYGNSLSNLKGRLEDSIKAYTMALKSDYHKPYLAYYNIACVYSRMENKEKAYEYLETAVQHGYRSFERLTKDPDLAYLRSRPDWEAFYKKLQN